MCKRIKNIIFLAVSVLLTAALLCSANAAAFTYRTSDFSFPSDSLQNKEILSGGGLGESYTNVLSNGTSELYYCGQSGSVAFFDTITKEAYYSNVFDNPALKGKSVGKMTGEIVLWYWYNGTTAYISSDDDRVTHEHVQSEDGSFTVKYTFNVEQNNSVSVNLKYTLSKNTLYVSASFSDIRLEKNCRILSIRLLSGMGCAVSDVNNYYMIPDGGGRLLSLDSKYQSQSIKSVVYGGDDASASPDEAELSSTALPVFGVKNGNRAFVAVIEENDALCSINSNRTLGDEVCYIYPEFNVTPSLANKTDDSSNLYVTALSFYNDIKIAYRFMSKGFDNYQGMAISCYEQFVRDGIISISETAAEDDSAPIVLSIDGIERDTDGNVLSTNGYSEVKALIEDLRESGVYDIYVKYTDSLDRNGNAYGKLGGKRKLTELYNFCKSNNIKIYFEVDPMSVNNQSSAASDILTMPTVHEDGSCYSSVGVFEKQIRKLFNNKRSYLDNIYIDKAGDTLYGDYRPNNPVGRKEMKDNISAWLDSLALDHGFMLSGINIYSVNKADVVTGLDFGKKIDGYTPVPFAQMVLHGNTMYASSELHGGKQLMYDIYRAFSYGSLPCFKISCSDNIVTSDVVPNENITDYGSWKNIIVEFYKKTHNAYSRLADKRLLNWYEVKEGIITAEYDGGIKLVVNATAEETRSGDQTVQPNSFLLTKS